MKIGEEITIRCVKATNFCEGCMFKGVEDCATYSPDECLALFREDGQAVIFVKVK